jgi:hypothetical protein
LLAVPLSFLPKIADLCLLDIWREKPAEIGEKLFIYFKSYITEKAKDSGKVAEFHKNVKLRYVFAK